MEIGKEYQYNTAITGKTKVHSLDSNYKINIKTSVIYRGIILFFYFIQKCQKWH